MIQYSFVRYLQSKRQKLDAMAFGERMCAWHAPVEHAELVYDAHPLDVFGLAP